MTTQQLAHAMRDVIEAREKAEQYKTAYNRAATYDPVPLLEPHHPLTAEHLKATIDHEARVKEARRQYDDIENKARAAMEQFLAKIPESMKSRIQHGKELVAQWKEDGINGVRLVFRDDYGFIVENI